MKRLVIPFFVFLTLITSMIADDLYTQKIHTLNGKDFDFSKLQGKVILFVNVASKCGFTPQYEGLQKLYSEMEDKGLVIIGVPSNDFKNQEPGTAEEIQTFCTENYGVTFPLTEKVHVRGSEMHPLYQFLTQTYGEPKWNFHKYLVDKHGNVIAAFPSKIAPDSQVLRQSIQQALNAL